VFDINFFLPIIVAIIYFVILFIDKFIKSNTQKKYVIIICSFIVTVFSIIIGSNAYNDTKNLKLLSNENKRLNLKNIELTEQNSKLIVTNKTITENVRDWFTGSDSFCFLEIVDNDKLKVFSKGKFPVRDVYVRVTDYYYINEKTNPKNLKPSKNYERTIDYVKFNLPRTLESLNLKDFVHNNKFSLTIFFETRNNSFTQHLSGEFVNGKLTKIYDNSVYKNSGHLTNLPKKLDNCCKKANLVW